jgi:uncharacterized membrane protein YgdD (TMEM256/DUF423 family)
MNKTILMFGILLGLLAVVFGAMGSHALSKLVDAKAIETFEVGIRYQMYHALFLLFLGSNSFITEKSKRWTFYTMALGVFLFSFSIYGLALNELTSFDFKSIAIVTPIGGTLLIVGWITLGYQILKSLK